MNLTRRRQSQSYLIVMAMMLEGERVTLLELCQSRVDTATVFVVELSTLL